MSALVEKYIHLVESFERLDQARKILCAIRDSGGPQLLVDAAMRSALVDYARPFKRTNGAHGPQKLSSEIVPAHAVAIHERIVRYRDKVVAHADQALRTGQLFLLDEGRGVAVVGDAAHIESDVAPLTALIDAVEVVCAAVYAEWQRIETTILGDPALVAELKDADLLF